MRALWCLGLVGCVSLSEPFSETVPSDGITAMRVDIERGSFVYEVDSDEIIVVQGESEARASSRQRAEQRLADNQVRIDVRGPTLVVETVSEVRRSNIDVDVFGPSILDLDVTANGGSVTLVDVQGSHVITAGRVQTTRLRGEATLTANGGGVDAEIYPYEQGDLIIDSTGGDVIVRVPFGPSYDVEILGDADFELFVAELGFVGSIAQPGYFSGVVGDGSVRIRITAQGGSVQLLQAL